jgi:ubiquinone/menaquinone biosynthesis C-methylase UbiE
MNTIYNIERVAQTYRTIHNRSAYADAHMNVVAQHVADRLDPNRPVAVLDVGCGAGASYLRLTEQLARAAGTLRYFGIDNARRQVELAHSDHAAAGNARFIIGSAEALPFGDNAFDAVFECRLFQFVCDPIGILREMIRTSRDLVVATLYTHEKNLACFHPMFDDFEMDQDFRITKGGAFVRDLNIPALAGTLVVSNGPNRYRYAFAKQRRTLIAHAELDEFLDHAMLEVLDRRVETDALSTIVSPDSGVTGLTNENDRLTWPSVRRQTLVLVKRG